MGQTYANEVLRKSTDTDLTKRAGELGEDEVVCVITIMQNPHQYRLPGRLLDRQKEVQDGKHSQVLANGLNNELQEDVAPRQKEVPREGGGTSGDLE